MTGPLTTWFLGGALAASLAWNIAPLLVPARTATLPSDARLPAEIHERATWRSELALDDRQLDALIACAQNCCSELCGVATGLATTRAKLDSALAADPFDPARIRRLADELGRLRAEATRRNGDALVRLREILRPDQLARLAAACNATATAN